MASFGEAASSKLLKMAEATAAATGGGSGFHSKNLFVF